MGWSGEWTGAEVVILVSSATFLSELEMLVRRYPGIKGEKGEAGQRVNNGYLH